MKYILIIIMAMFMSCHVVEYNLPRWDGSVQTKDVKFPVSSSEYKVYRKYLNLWGKYSELSFEPGYAIYKGDTLRLEICDSIPLSKDYKLWLDCSDGEFLD